MQQKVLIAYKKKYGVVSACFAAMSPKDILCYPFNITLSSLPLTHVGLSQSPLAAPIYECNADFILSM